MAKISQTRFALGGRLYGSFLGRGSSAVTLAARWTCSDKSGLTVRDVSGNARHMTASGMLSAELWANGQDVFHYSIRNGFEASGAVEIPFGAHANLTNPAGVWHNDASTQIDFTSGVDAPWVDKWSYPGYVDCVAPLTGKDVFVACDAETGTAISVYARVRDLTANALAKNWFGIDDGTNTNRALFGVDAGDDLYLWTNKEYEFGSPPSYTPFRDGEWHDVLMTISGTTAKCYVDGAQLGGNIALEQGIDWSTFTRARVLTHPDGTSNDFVGAISRLVVYASEITPAQIESAANVLDIRFRYDRWEDEDCRIPTSVWGTNITPATAAIPTAYTAGTSLPEQMSKAIHPTNGFERFYDLTDPDPIKRLTP